jgi:DNA-3-methyladenine glycosylase II
LSAGDAAAGVAHLRAADPLMAQLVETYGALDLIPPHRLGNSHYGALVRAIVGQQLSVKAAASIYKRVEELFGGHAPTPGQIVEAETDALRAAGLSRAKVVYLRSLAEHVLDGSLDLDRLEELGDDEALAKLVAVKGLGQWTAQMFLMFQLSRPDVLPVGDLGIRRAAQRLYGLGELPTPAELERIAEPWRPWRTLGCRYLWASLENAPV